MNQKRKLVAVALACLCLSAACDSMPKIDGPLGALGTDVTDPVDDVVDESQMAASGIQLKELFDRSSVRPVIALGDGIPTHVEVRVPMGTPDDADVVEAALDYLERYSALYGLTDPASQLVPERVFSDASGDHIFFAQQQFGIVVHGAQLAVHSGEGNVLATNGRYLPTLPPAAEPTLLPEAAAEMAIGATGGKLSGAVTLVYYNAALLGLGDNETHLAWCVPIAGDCATPQGCGSRRVFIDGDSGEVLATEDDATHCSKNFDINHANGTTSSTCWNLPWETADDEMYDEDGRWCGIFEGCATTTPDGFAAFNAAHRTYDYFANTFGRCGWDGNDAQLEVMVHVGFNPANAEYNRGCDYIAFSNNYVHPDSFAHEYTHAVTRWTAGLMSAGESGSLNEHYSDVFASMFDNNWLIAEAIPGGAIRDMANPSNAPWRDADHMQASQCTAGKGFNAAANKYTNTGIMNKAASLLTDGGAHKGVSVNGIGREKVARLFYNVLTGRLTSNSRFIDARNASVTLARQWYLASQTYGFTRSDVCSVINAYAAVGLGAADLDCDGYDDAEDLDDDGDGVPDVRDNCPRIKNPYQENNDGDAQGDACDNDDDNDGIPDNIDKCPFNFNPDQKDTDGDGIPDACDNCPDYTEIIPGPTPYVLRRYANPDQTDTDRDGRGDLCDDDDDNDGIPDFDDNCPLVRNPSQLDLNEDGIGFACDEQEQRPFKRQYIPANWKLIEIDSCPPCGDYFSPIARARLEAVLPAGMSARIVDEFGNVVGKPSNIFNNDGIYEWSFEFKPRASTFYRFPTRATMFTKGLFSADGRATMHASRYYLQTIADPQYTEPGTEPFAVTIVTE